MKIGIVGLPNVGKSTLFNALTKSHQAEVQNYPFCTISPNVGVVEVPDERLQKLAAISRSAKIVPAVVEFVDIAGLVKGASKGEGLGNQFLAHIREVDAVVQVVRQFKDEGIVHVAGKIDPEEDKSIINIELALSDLATVARVLERAEKETKSGFGKELAGKIETLQKLHTTLSEGSAARSVFLSDEEKALVRDLNLLTMKPMLYVYNGAETETGAMGEVHGVESTLYISAKLEADLAALSDEEAAEYRAALGLKESGLERFIRASYALLDLITFFTSGEKETRAWTVKRGAKAPAAAGVIHSDFERGFIRAEVIAYDDFVACGGELGAREKGKLRIEGKEYVIADGDVCHFRFQV